MSLRSLKYLFIIFLVCTACSSDKEKLNALINFPELYIQKNAFGGLVGYNETFYHIYSSENTLFLIVNEGGEIEKKIIMIPKKQSQLDFFLKSSFITNEPDRKMSNSCMGSDQEYIISSGFTKLIFRPDYICDSLFNEILYGN